MSDNTLPALLYLLLAFLYGYFHKGSFNARFAAGIFFPVFVLARLVQGTLELLGVKTAK